MIKLMHGDCLELMKEIPDGSIDLVLTDPPYRVISGGANNRKSGVFKNWSKKTCNFKKNDGKVFKYNDIKIDQWAPEIFRVLKENSHVYIMVNFLNLEIFMATLKRVGFKLHNLLVWEKNQGSPNRWYYKNCEYIIFARKGKAKPINNMGSKTVHSFKIVKKGKKHPTEKPVDLIQMYILNSTNKHEIVLDPFMGSGSTGVACKNLNRKFIGIEKDDKYFKIAQERINEN